jgi:uncharacterized protein (TIGR02452 family)
MLLNRTRAAALGQETVQILKVGHYKTEAGTAVEIGELLQHAVEGTCSYPPEYQLPTSHLGERQTHIEVKNETTLEAARKLVDEGHRPVALNFASAKHPGGGFLGGARAQEESLARSSGLYACLVGHAMYDLHQAARDPMYTSYAIYSPDVPVFRTDEGKLLEQPYLCGFITAPAVNAKVVLERDPSRRSAIRDAMWERILKVLAIATINGHETLVLGAWGCGVFGNDTQEVAELFGRALTERFRGAFTKVVFAILDWSEDRHFIGPFQRVFGKEAPEI